MSQYVHGQTALNALPDDSRLHVQLSHYFYDRTLRQLRNDMISNRSGLAVVEVATPINAPPLQIGPDRRSVYVWAFRQLGQKEWWAFLDDGCPATLPGGATRRINGRNTYTWLGLPPSINMHPIRLLARLAAFDGNIDPETARALVLLLFLVAEALRFDDVLMECCRYLSAGTTTACTLLPGKFRNTVTNWASAGQSGNVLLPYLA